MASLDLRIGLVFGSFRPDKADYRGARECLARLAKSSKGLAVVPISNLTLDKQELRISVYATSGSGEQEGNG